MERLSVWSARALVFGLSAGMLGVIAAHGFGYLSYDTGKAIGTVLFGLMMAFLILFGV